MRHRQKYVYDVWNHVLPFSFNDFLSLLFFLCKAIKLWFVGNGYWNLLGKTYKGGWENSGNFFGKKSFGGFFDAIFFLKFQLNCPWSPSHFIYFRTFSKPSSKITYSWPASSNILLKCSFHLLKRLFHIFHIQNLNCITKTP